MEAAEPMSEARFWDIVDRSRSPDRGAQIAVLKQLLNSLTPGELVAWEKTFDKQMRRSYRWNLWGAAYIAMGGASDDSFEYFRLWLISRGQQTFETVLTSPDALADVASDDPEQLEFEDFAHAAPDVWSAKTGKGWDEMPSLSSFFDPAGYGAPTGQQFSDDPPALAAKYPKLWRRFGHAHSSPQ